MTRAVRCMARAPEYRPCFDAAAVAFESGAQPAKAQEAAARARALDPGFVLAALPEVLPFKNAADLQLFQTALAATGLK